MKRVGLIIVSENSESREMLKSLKRLLGDTSGIEAVRLLSKYKTQVARALLERSLAKVNRGGGCLILANLFGSTQCNACMPLLKKGKIEMISGFNFPMLLKASFWRDEKSVREIGPLLLDYGRAQMRHVTSKRNVR